MINITMDNVSKDFDKYVSLCLKQNEAVRISTENGNAIMISEKHYNDLIESLYLMGIKDIRNDIEDTINKQVEEFLKEPPWDEE